MGTGPVTESTHRASLSPRKMPLALSVRSMSDDTLTLSAAWSTCDQDFPLA